MKQTIFLVLTFFALISNSTEAQILSVNDAKITINGNSQSSGHIGIDVTEAGNCTAMAFKIVFPSDIYGIDIVKSDGLSHKLYVYEDKYMFIADDNSKFKESLELMTMSIKSSFDAYGSYSCRITDIELATTDFQLITLQDVLFTVNVDNPNISSAIPGDVNLDKKVNITDAVDIINDRLGYEAVNFIRSLSDVNNDGQFTIADAIAVLNIMYGEPVGANAVQRKATVQDESLALYQTDASSLALDMNCVNGYSAFQFDVVLPEGVELNGVTLNTDRCPDFAVQFNRADNNTYKVVAYNLANESFETGNGNLLTLQIAGNRFDAVKLTDIHFSTLHATDVMFDDVMLGSTTGIQPQEVQTTDVDYNTAGVRVSKDAKGIIISNGKKIFRK